MRSSLFFAVALAACTTTVKGEGPGGSTSGSTSGSSSGGTAGTSSSGSSSACADSFDCKGIPYCACPGSDRDGIGSWSCPSGSCVVDCSDALCP